MVVVTLALVGTALVGSDFAARSVPFYLAKPISRWHYIGGKCLAVAAIVPDRGRYASRRSRQCGSLQSCRRSRRGSGGPGNDWAYFGVFAVIPIPTALFSSAIVVSVVAIVILPPVQRLRADSSALPAACSCPSKGRYVGLRESFPLRAF